MRKLIIFLVVIICAYSYAKHIVVTGKLQSYLDTHKKSFAVEPTQYYIGRYQYVTGKYDRAINQLKKFIKLYPKSEYNEQALLFLAHSLAVRHRKDEAIERYEEFLEKYPSSSKVVIVENKLRFMKN